MLRRKLLLIGLCVGLIVTTGCDVTTGMVLGVAGIAGEQTPVYRDTEGNIFGYYEYLPEQFTAESTELFPLVFYWNGANTIRGNGRDELAGMLDQGLPEFIGAGKHYPAIIISGMFNNWETDDPHPFVEYILRRYRGYFDPQRIYMTGFSAGGGVTLRYVSKHPGEIAAIVPIGSALAVPDDDQPSTQMAAIPSWLFHNKGDPVVASWRSVAWHEELVKKGGDHRLSLIDVDNHYAWQDAYDNPELWTWLLSQRKSGTGTKPIQLRHD